MQRIECTGTHNQLNIHRFDKVAVHIRVSVSPLVPLDIEKVVHAIRRRSSLLAVVHEIDNNSSV